VCLGVQKCMCVLTHTKVSASQRAHTHDDTTSLRRAWPTASYSPSPPPAYASGPTFNSLLTSSFALILCEAPLSFFEKQKLVAVTVKAACIDLYSHYKTHDAKNGRRIDDFTVLSSNKHTEYVCPDFKQSQM
jgi:hypothetical protein